MKHPERVALVQSHQGRAGYIPHGRTASKYHAVPTVVDGVRFASKAEARRYSELQLLAKAGQIEDLVLQPRFPLHARSSTGQVGEAIKALAGTRDTKVGEYRGDFSYFDWRRSGRIVEDVKSPATRTAIYRWKIKHLAIQYGIKVVEIMYAR
jgi:hypothetical protein